MAPSLTLCRKDGQQRNYSYMSRSNNRPCAFNAHLENRCLCPDLCIACRV
jgi:hypothetical protein